MNKYLLLLIATTLFFSCGNNEYSVGEIKFNDNTILVCDEAKVKEEREIPLSRFIDDLQIIRLENDDNAFFQFGWIAISPNYFAIRQYDGGPIKLFNKKGEFINNIGNVGQGPGEYGSVYDILIDETNDAVYVTQIVGDEIMVFNLQGEFKQSIEFKDRLNKPRLFMNADGSLSLTHLCFTDKNSPFTIATIDIANPDSVRYLFTENLASSSKNREGHTTGLNNEIWSYRNSKNFPFMYTITDTLYNYNISHNEVEAKFTLSMTKERKGKSFFVFNELPAYFHANIVGGEHRKSILIDKTTKEAYAIKVVNDFLGNLPTSARFQDGYYFEIAEPLILKEKIEEHIYSGDCPSSQIDQLTALLNSLHENDNNILLLGSLRTSAN